MFHLLATSVHIPRDNNQDEFPHNGKQDIYDTDAMKKASRDHAGHADISTLGAVGMKSDPSRSVPLELI